MGLIDVRRFWVTTHVDGSGELAVSDVGLAEESEWDVNLAQVVEVNALCVPASRPLTYQVMDNELRLLASFLLDKPGAPISVRHQEFRASAGHVKRFVTESFGLGMLTAAVERYYRWKLKESDLANFDVLPGKYKDEYPASGVRPDLLFDFTSQGHEKCLAGEARGRSERRPKKTDRDQRERLDQIVAWSGRNDFHPVTMTWAYSGAKRVQVDFFDIQDPEDMYGVSEDDPRKLDVLTASPALPDITVRFLRQRALGRTAAIANKLYETAPQPVPERARQVFGRNIRGEWTTADLVAPSNLRVFLGILDQAFDRQQAGASRRARNASSQAWDADPIQIAVTQRILVVVARDSAQDLDWSEVTRRIEQPGRTNQVEFVVHGAAGPNSQAGRGQAAIDR